MMKNPVLWACIMALLFFVWKREEIFSPTSPTPAIPAPQQQPGPPTQAMPLMPPPIQPPAETSEFSGALPTRDEMAHLTDDEVHHQLPQNNRLGAQLASLIQQANANPALRTQTLKTVLHCAENDEILRSARALCWWKLTNKLNEWKVFIPVADAKVPLEIQRLAASIDSMPTE